MTAKMTKFLTFSRKKFSDLLYCALCIFLSILVSACSDAQYSSSETGSIAFSIEWKGAPTIQLTSRAIKAASLDCDAAGVTTVRFDLYDENNSYLVGDSWSCSYHEGTVHDVPVGSNRKLVVTGEDSSGNVLYRGEVTGITVAAGQTTNVGTIVVEPIENTPPTATITSPTNGSTYTEGDDITFSGTGEDAEDGTLTSSSLVWTSSIDGQIGTGESFTRNDLSVGTHTITLTATDSDDATGSDSITVTVFRGMTFELIPVGTFTMGSPTDELGRNDDETQHEVTLTKDFYLQTTEVTQGQWKAVMGQNPSHFSDCGDDCPVEQVSWDDVQEFIEKLNEMEGTDTYRLPTEAEWEYACRAGSTTAFANGEITNTEYDDPNLDQIGWYGGNSDNKTHPVAQKEPNDWGLYDMHGNVWEWCQDRDGDYPIGQVTDPTGPSSGTYRMFRGGGWNYYAWNCRSAFRGRDDPGFRGDRSGFRVARDF